MFNVTDLLDFSVFLTAIKGNGSLVVIAAVGGLVLFGIKIVEHFVRKPIDKLPLWRYFGFFVFLMISLPFLGFFVTLVYLVNGDRISSILAFQIGITSPAIVQSLMISAANNLGKKSAPETQPGQ